MVEIYTKYKRPKSDAWKRGKCKKLVDTTDVENDVKVKMMIASGQRLVKARRDLYDSTHGLKDYQDGEIKSEVNAHDEFFDIHDKKIELDNRISEAKYMASENARKASEEAKKVKMEQIGS
jgi:hypothetical protein